MTPFSNTQETYLCNVFILLQYLTLRIPVHETDLSFIKKVFNEF